MIRKYKAVRFISVLLVTMRFCSVAAWCGPGEDALDLLGSNNQKALELAKSAAQEGDPSAQYVVGCLYNNGWVVEKDKAEADKWFAKALVGATPLADSGDAAAQFVLGTLYERGKAVDKNLTTALGWYRKSAEQGYANAQTNLGAMYLNGTGVEKNFEMAADWFRKAAEQGIAVAQASLGLMYQDGIGVEKNLETAVGWHRKAAEQGFAPAQTNLGLMYENGTGVKQDFKMAAAWYRKAAEQGFAVAQRDLGNMYFSGTGVGKSLETTFAWYRKAAEQGDADSQYNLGVMYENGLGVDKNDQLASYWYRKAADQEYIPQHRNHQPGDLWDDARGTRFERKKATATAYSGGGISKEEMQQMVDDAAAKAAASSRIAIPTSGTAQKSAEFESDVDTPTYSLEPQPDNFALVIGISQYRDVPEAQFAERDARAVKQHLLALGYPEENIIMLIGPHATKSTMEDKLERWLPMNVTEKSTVFVYYSGHGAPDAQSKKGYIVPWDGEPESLETTAFSLVRFYNDLNKLPAKRVFVALDLCFSGAGGRSVLPKGAKPLFLSKIATGVPETGKLTVFTASDAAQISGTLEEQGHGMFTYYFLKGLNGAEASKAEHVTVGSLYTYLCSHVNAEAHRQEREQSPQLLPSATRDAALQLR